MMTREEVIDKIDRNRNWFNANEPHLRSTEYLDSYVAVYEESIWGSDKDLPKLLERFYNTVGDGPAFFGYVGDQPPVAGPTACYYGDES